MVLQRRLLAALRSAGGRLKAADTLGTRLTGRELLVRILAAKRVLDAVLDPDERMVGVMLPSCVAGVVVNAALALSGRISVNLNYTASQSVLDLCVERAGLRRVISSPAFLARVRLRLGDRLLDAGALKDRLKTSWKLMAFLDATIVPLAILERRLGLDRIRPDDPLTVIFTSGSTGDPKGVVLTVENVGSNVRAIDELVHLSPADVALGVLPSAVTQSIHVSLDGGTTWAERTPSPAPSLNGGTPSAVDISPDGTTIALATTAGVLISVDDGSSWQATGITAGVTGVALGTDGSGLLISAFDGAGLRQVRLSGSEVVNAHRPGGINNFAVSDDGQVILLAAGGTPVTTHLSLDGGTTWTTDSDIGIGSNTVAPVTVSPDGTRRAVAAYGGGLAESTGASTTWVPVEPSGFTTLTWSSLAYSGNGATLVGGPDSGSRLAIRRDTPAPAVEPGTEVEVGTGGGPITVFGSYFYDVTSVTVGGVATTYTVVNAAQIRIDVPAGAVGTADLVITSAHGSVTVSGAIVYRPTPPPSIDGWEVADGETPGWSGVDVGLDGGIELYLYGEHFVDVTSITVGGRPVTDYEVDSDSTILLVLPPGEAGLADLVLTTAHGSTTLSDVIEYHGGSGPTIDSLGPTSGTHRGGQVVLVRGAGLNDTTEVLFGAEPAEFEVVSPRFLVATSPSNRIGLMDISITNGWGTTVLTDAWTSVWAPYSPEWSRIGPDEDDVDDPMTPMAVAPMSIGDIADPPGDVTTVLPDGTGGFYLLGDFEDAGDLDEADLIVRWTGTAWATVGGDGSGDGRLRSSGETGVFLGSGVRTAAFDADGRLWVGGAFELDGREVNIARVDPASGAWWAPTVVPDDIVETIEFDGATVIVAGDFGPLSGVPASSRIARL
ncbi:MAG: IPT/TIG domain-containing protein, partial [Ilumatobacteraceae bacterium]